METKLEQIAAKAVKQRPKSVVREIRTPRSVGTGGGRPPPVTRLAPSNGCPYRNRILEPSQFIRLLDTAVAFRRRDRRRIGDRSHLPQAERIGWALPIAVGCTRVAFPVYPSVGPSNASRIFSSTVAPTNAFPWRKPDAIHRGYLGQ